MFQNEKELVGLGKTKIDKANRQKVLQILDYTLGQSDPYFLTKKYLAKKDLGKFDRIFVVGAGKGTYRMAVAAEEILGKKLTAGFINIPSVIKGAKLKKIKFTLAGHPFPTKGSVEGAQKIIALIKKAQPKDLIIGLFSGGASALMCAPAEGISLEDKIAVTGLLLKCGATINEVNTIRKHLSLIKGGQLADLAGKTVLIAYYLSDVVGDDLSTIACGPTVLDQTTFKDAWAILTKYSLIKKIPAAVRLHLEDGLKGKRDETPKKILKNVSNIMIGSHKTLAEAALKQGRVFGFGAKIITTKMQGNTEKVSKDLLGLLQKEKGQKKLLIATGETNLKIRTSYPGGRNQQMGLAVLPHLKSGEIFVAFDSDGVDGVGPERVGGVIVDYDTLQKAKAMGMDIKKALQENNSYNFFKQVGGAIKTGYVGTNLGDIVILFKQ